MESENSEVRLDIAVGDCNTLTCDTAYWSGATVSDFEGASKELMKAFGLSDNPAQYCPGQNPK